MADSQTSRLTDQITQARTNSRGWHIQRLSAQLDHAMDQQLKAHGLTIQSFALVMTALEHDGLTQKDLCARFSAPAYAITRALDQLEREGFIERRTNAQSRRSNTVHATDQAAALAPKLLDVIEDVNAKLVAGLNEKDAAKLLALLQRALQQNALKPGGG